MGSSLCACLVTRPGCLLLCVLASRLAAMPTPLLSPRVQSSHPIPHYYLSPQAGPLSLLTASASATRWATRCTPTASTRTRSGAELLPGSLRNRKDTGVGRFSGMKCATCTHCPAQLHSTAVHSASTPCPLSPPAPIVRLPQGPTDARHAAGPELGARCRAVRGCPDAGQVPVVGRTVPLSWSRTVPQRYPPTIRRRQAAWAAQPCCCNGSPWCRCCASFQTPAACLQAQPSGFSGAGMAARCPHACPRSPAPALVRTLSCILSLHCNQFLALIPVVFPFFSLRRAGLQHRLRAGAAEKRAPWPYGK